MYKDFLVDFWFNLNTRIRVLTLIFILSFLVGCSDKKTILEYPNVKLKNYGDTKEKIIIEGIKKDNDICINKDEVNKLVFDISLLKLNLKNYEDQTNLYNNFFKNNK